MKKKIIGVALICSAFLVSCGVMNMSKSSENSVGLSDIRFDHYESYQDEDYKNSGSEDQNYSDDVIHAADIPDKITEEIKPDKIEREMLVYSCNMNIDVLEFDKSLEQLKASLNKYDGFVESETYSDGGSLEKWYFENEEKWMSYRATVRVPSSVYDEFCDEAASLGNLRSKNASVDNLTTEYRDLSSTLKIYEQKEERYISLLSEIKDESQAVIIEDKLTEIQIEIARLRSRMNKIDKDVAYSYVYLSVNEVKEYHSEPVKTDTFGQRFVNTVKDSASEFLNFLEVVLNLAVYALPYLIFFGLGIFVVAKIVTAIVRRKKKRDNSDRHGMSEINTEKTNKTQKEKTDSEEIKQ